MIGLLAGVMRLGCSVALPLVMNVLPHAGGAVRPIMSAATGVASALVDAGEATSFGFQFEPATSLGALVQTSDPASGGGGSSSGSQSTGAASTGAAKPSASAKPRSSQPGAATDASATGATGSAHASGTGSVKAHHGSGAHGDAASEKAQPRAGENGTGAGADNESGSGSEAAEGEGHRHIHYSASPSFSMGDTDVTVREGEEHADDIVCIGGRVVIQGTQDGDVVVIGGVVRLSGHVSGDMVCIASRVELAPGAVIDGSLVSIAGSVNRPEGVTVRDGFTSVDFPNLGRFASGHGLFRFLAVVAFWFTILFTGIRFLAVLILAAIAPGRIEGALTQPRPSWVAAFFLGLLIYLVGHLLTLVFCLLLPLGIAMWIALHVSIWMGLAAISLNIGRAIGRTVFGRELSYFGAILAGFSLFALAGLIPCFGWVLNTMAAMTGLGLMLLTRYGGPKRAPRAPGPVTPIPAKVV